MRRVRAFQPTRFAALQKPSRERKAVACATRKPAGHQVTPDAVAQAALSLAAAVCLAATPASAAANVLELADEAKPSFLEQFLSSAKTISPKMKGLFPLSTESPPVAESKPAEPAPVADASPEPAAPPAPEPEASPEPTPEPSPEPSAEPSELAPAAAEPPAASSEEPPAESATSEPAPAEPETSPASDSPPATSEEASDTAADAPEAVPAAAVTEPESEPAAPEATAVALEPESVPPPEGLAADVAVSEEPAPEPDSGSGGMADAIGALFADMMPSGKEEPADTPTAADGAEAEAAQVQTSDTQMPAALEGESIPVVQEVAFMASAVADGDEESPTGCCCKCC